MIKSVIVLILAFLIPAYGIASSECKVAVAWDANTEPDLSGYEIHYGTSPGEYTTVINVHNEPGGRDTKCDLYDPFKLECCEYTITFPRPGTYYLAATAYDDCGNDSDFSDELTHQTAAVCGSAKPTIPTVTSPAPGHMISESSQKFCFDAADIEGVTRWAFWLGSEVGKYDIERISFDKDLRCFTIINIPLIEKKKVYLILWWKIDDKWFRNPENYEYFTTDKTAPEKVKNLKFKK